MNTCKTCKWWGHETITNEHRLCNHPKLDISEGGSKDGLSPGTHPDGELTTGPDFGCVHWEQKI